MSNGRPGGGRQRARLVRKPVAFRGAGGDPQGRRRIVDRETNEETQLHHINTFAVLFCQTLDGPIERQKILLRCVHGQVYLFQVHFVPLTPAF